MRRISVLLILISTANAFGSNLSCRVAEKLRHVDAAHVSFWQEFGSLSQTANGMTDDAVEALIRKHDIRAASPVSARNTTGVTPDEKRALYPPTRPRIEMGREVIKQVGKLPKHLENKFRELLNQLEGADPGAPGFGLQGGWKFEPLREGKNRYSVRLNQGYRVVFKIEGRDIHIEGVGKDLYDH